MRFSLLFSLCPHPLTLLSRKIPTDAKLAFFNETRHAYGRTALLLSGGAALGYYHSGLTEELLKSGLLPRVASGASAGSLLVSMLGFVLLPFSSSFLRLSVVFPSHLIL